MEQISLSFVLRASEAAATLAAVVADCQASAVRYADDYEIIIVDDASTDGTAAIADRLATTHGPVAVIRYPRRRGYRRALHDAWGATRCRYIIALDLTGITGATVIPRLLEALSGHQVIVGYREPAPAWPHERIFAAAVSARLAPGMRDPALRIGVFRSDLRALLDPNGHDALAHAEIFAGAQQRGHFVAQVAVPARSGGTTALSLHAALDATLHAGHSASLPRGRKGRAVGAGMLLAAVSLWLVRRRRR